MPDSRRCVRRPAVAAAVVVQGGRVVLLIRRRVSEGLLSWQFPAGAVVDGESAARAVARETAEETGLRVAATAVLGERVHPDTGRTMVYIACRVVSGTAGIGDPREVAEIAWASRADLLPTRAASWPPMRPPAGPPRARWRRRPGIG
jgi:8-oxo-dGTP diphosphatase